MIDTIDKVRSTREKTAEDRMISVFRASMGGGTNISDLSKEMSVCRATARKYARISADANMVVISEEMSSKNTHRSKIVARRYIYFAILKLERDLFKLTFFSFFPRDIRVLYLPYNEALMPEDNAEKVTHLLKNICNATGAWRIFLGVIKCEGTQMDDTAYSSLCADQTLSRSACELLSESKEKERALTVTEYFFNSVRNARTCDIDTELWQSIDSAERGMIDALLMKIASDAHRSSLGRD